MKVTLRTFGGIAPAVRPPEREVEAGALSAADAARLARLVESVPASTTSPPPRPDERHYEIAIHAPQGTRVLRCSDTSMDDRLAALVDFIERHGQRL